MKIFVLFLALYSLNGVASEQDSGKSEFYSYSISVQEDFDEVETKPTSSETRFFAGKRILTGVVVVAAAIAGIYFYRTSGFSTRTLADNNGLSSSKLDNFDLDSSTFVRSNSLPTSFTGIAPLPKEHFTQQAETPAIQDDTRRLYSEVLMNQE